MNISIPLLVRWQQKYNNIYLNNQTYTLPTNIFQQGITTMVNSTFNNIQLTNYNQALYQTATTMLGVINGATSICF